MILFFHLFLVFYVAYQEYCYNLIFFGAIFIIYSYGPANVCYYLYVAFLKSLFKIPFLFFVLDLIYLKMFDRANCCYTYNYL